MKVEELPSELFAGCPRYLTLERFTRLAGLQEQEQMLVRWVEEGVLPTRRFGRHRLIDIQALLQRLDHSKGTPG